MRIRHSAVLAAVVAGLLVGSSAAQAEGPKGAPCVGGPVTSAANFHIVLDRTAVRGIFLAEIDDTGAERAVCASWSLSGLLPSTRYRIVIASTPCAQTPAQAHIVYIARLTSGVQGRSSAFWYNAQVMNESFTSGKRFRLYRGWAGSDLISCGRGLVAETTDP